MAMRDWRTSLRRGSGLAGTRRSHIGEAFWGSGMDALSADGDEIKK
jgi:hypothetical protein